MWILLFVKKKKQQTGVYVGIVEIVVLLVFSSVWFIDRRDTNFARKVMFFFCLSTKMYHIFMKTLCLYMCDSGLNSENRADS